MAGSKKKKRAFGGEGGLQISLTRRILQTSVQNPSCAVRGILKFRDDDHAIIRN